MKRTLFAIIFFSLSPWAIAGGGSSVPLEQPKLDLTDYASMQRGAKLFFGRCQGCHSLKFMRYDSLAKGIKISDEDGNILNQIVKKNLLFVGEKLSDPILTAMAPEDSAAWFGIVPPDLSLTARRRGPDWFYTYMKSFYVDPSKPWGVNNVVYEGVAMPHVLADLQGLQVANYKPGSKDEVQSLSLSEKGALSPAEYDRLMVDLTNFLTYASEPVQLERRSIGAWVLVFLGILFIFSYLLKREYWKKVH